MGVVISGIHSSGSITITGNKVYIDGNSAETVKGDGVPAQEHRDLADRFHAIDASGIDQLEVKCGQAGGVDVSGDSNIVPLIETRVEDGVLHVEPKSGSYSRQTPVRVAVFAEDLDGLDLSGQVRASVKDVRGKEFELSLSGQTAATLTGSTGALFVDASGQSKVDAQDLSAGRVRAEVSGQSRAKVRASDKLTVDASGMSEVAYFGDPQLRKDVSGMSSVRKVG